MPNKLSEQLRHAWQQQFHLVQQIQEYHFAERADDGERPRSGLEQQLQSLAQLRTQTTELQRDWHRLGTPLPADLLQLREQTKQLLTATLARVQTAQRRATHNKGEVLEQLSQVNKANAGFQGYRQ